MPNAHDRPAPRVELGSRDERLMETPELIDRMAEELRATSGSDLPHAYFVELLKLKLAGKTAAEHDLSEDDDDDDQRGSLLKAARTSPSLFQSWAIPEN